MRNEKLQYVRNAVIRSFSYSIHRIFDEANFKLVRKIVIVNRFPRDTPFLFSFRASFLS